MTNGRGHHQLKRFAKNKQVGFHFKDLLHTLYVSVECRPHDRCEAVKLPGNGGSVSSFDVHDTGQVTFIPMGVLQRMGATNPQATAAASRNHRQHCSLLCSSDLVPYINEFPMMISRRMLRDCFDNPWQFGEWHTVNEEFTSSCEFVRTNMKTFCKRDTFQDHGT
jgi:hypothetical protein